VKVVLSVGKRKTAVARAVVKPGKGRVWVNGIPLELYPVELAKLKMMEPLALAGQERWSQVDIRVTVAGGGVMGQADAARVAIARGLVEYFEDEKLKNLFLSYDRTLLSGDPRQTEPEKYMRRSARRRWQKSYR